MHYLNCLLYWERYKIIKQKKNTLNAYGRRIFYFLDKPHSRNRREDSNDSPSSSDGSRQPVDHELRASKRVREQEASDPARPNYLVPESRGSHCCCVPLKWQQQPREDGCKPYQARDVAQSSSEL